MDSSGSIKTVIGINFGDSFASIAVINKEGIPECIANEDGERQIACAISYQGEEEYIGSVALPHLVKNSKNTIINFKNLLGKKFSSLSTSDAPSAPVVAGPNDEPAYVVTILTPPPPQSRTPARSSANTPMATPRPSSPIQTQRTITVSEATTIFVKSLVQSAADFLGKPVDGAIITVPVWFDADARSALKRAAEASGIQVFQLLDEPGAVALAYMNLSEKTAIHEDKTSLVIDLGANSLDLSLLSLKQGLVHTLATLHDPAIGGSCSIDTILINHFAKEFTKKTKVPLSFPAKTPDDKRAEARLRLAVEHTKRTISARGGTATCSVESLKDGMDFTGTITRLRFDLLVASVYQKVVAKVRELLAQAQTDIVHVDEVLLVGASAALPGLADELQNSLIRADEEEGGVPQVRSDIETFEVIARGAALQAQLLASLPDEDLAAEFTETPKWAEVMTTVDPIILVFPSNAEGQKKWAKLVSGDTPLPCRRVLRFDADPKKAKSVGFEIWIGKDVVKVEKQVAPSTPGEDEDEEEPEERRWAEIDYVKKLGGLRLDLTATKKTRVLVKAEIGVGGGLEVKLWEEGKDDAGKTLNVAAP